MVSIDPIPTERLLLKPLETGDSKFVLELVNTEQWLRNIGERNVTSENAARIYIEKILANPTVKYWVVTLKANQAAVGIITLLKREYLQHWDLGFALLPHFNGKGYAFEGSRAILDHISRTTNLRKIMAITIPANTPSVKLLLNLGFNYESEIVRDNERLSVYCIDI